MMRYLELHTTLTLELVPGYDHIVTAKNYNSPMAKRQLVSHSSRGTLPDRIGELSIFKTIAASVCDSLAGLQKAPTDSGDSYPEVLIADQALDSANLAMIVLAGCSVVEEHASSASGRTMASQVLEKAPAGFPDSLERRLAKIAAAC